MIPKRPISNALAPNIQKDDVFLAKKLLSGASLFTMPNGVKVAVRGQRTALEAYFCARFGVKKAFAFNAGRSALLAILRALSLPPGSQIAVQAFTCNAVINPILKAGYRPVYIDIDDDLNLDVSKLKQKLGEVRAILVQHTFGMPAKIKEICALAEEKNIFVIEDCAHALGVSLEGQPLGGFGDAAFFSFGRDKVISSTYGGLALAKNPAIVAALEGFYQNCALANPEWTKRQLRHPVLFNNVVLPFYNFFDLGKKFLSLYLRTRRLSRAVEPQECLGQWSESFPFLLPDELAVLALNQLQKLSEFSRHREALAAQYFSLLQGNLKIALPFIEAQKQPLPFMRFPILAKDRAPVLKYFAKQGIYLDDGWGGKNIVPAQTDLSRMGYILGSCPRSEIIAKKIINLPLNINTSLSEAKKIVDKLENIL
ncbi:MAG: aminotransferase class I/II-fold pyridoxal phosphate-dependent enzyme [Candidatus Paceibacterota bacterium]